jgi:uncharacterized protein (TIGR01777 family)
MRFLVAGASGFLGSHLRTTLVEAGHDVTALVRRAPGAGEAQWDPYSADLDLGLVERADVVGNRAGSPTLGNPHSRAWAERLRPSRGSTTQVRADAIAASDRRPAFLAGNAVGFYGDHGDQPVAEDADSRGDSLLSAVTIAWQAAAQPAVDAGARVCILRTSPVMDRRNPPLRQQLLQFKAGLGGRMGSGRQYMPMISLRDWLAAVTFLAEHDETSGPVNHCCPQPPTNAEFSRQLARLVHRPSVLHLPAGVLKIAAGPMAPELLGSVRVVPRVLTDAGFQFTDRDVAEILASAVR